MSDDAGFTLENARARLPVHESDLPRTARDVAALLAQTGRYFERGKPVSLIRDEQSGWQVARPFTRETVVHAVHDIAQPYVERVRKQKAEEADVTLPDRVAALYLDMDGQRGLPPLRGVAYSPLLSAGGGIRTADGYDGQSQLWCASAPDACAPVPDRPSRKQALVALLKLRRLVATFPFADSPRCRDAAGQDVVDLAQPPGMDESSLLAGLLTAICRPSLDIAPGLLVRAPNINGSGTGKGLLAKIVCAIAFGRTPETFTGGQNVHELELRVGAALMEATPAVFLDNLNGVTLQSDLLANVLTEPLASVRVLGFSKMVKLNTSCFLVITGNGISLAEDLVRRFIVVELDAHSENPEARCFSGDLLADVRSRRAELAAAALTIWRWAQLNPRKLRQGATMGGYRQWGAWVRDALLTLGAADPAMRIAEIKSKDVRRQDIASVYEVWQSRHGNNPVRAHALDLAVKQLIDPHNRGRQHVAAWLGKHDGTMVNGFVLSRSKSAGKWGADTYAVLPATYQANLPGMGRQSR